MSEQPVTGRVVFSGPQFTSDKVAAAIRELRDALDAKDARIKELEGALRDEAMNQLPALMSDISEEHWAADWMAGTEVRLWDFMTNESDDGKWGMGNIDPEYRARLKLLSSRCGGWFNYEGFIPMEEWKRAREALK